MYFDGLDFGPQNRAPPGTAGGMYVHEGVGTCIGALLMRLPFTSSQ